MEITYHPYKVIKVRRKKTPRALWKKKAIEKAKLITRKKGYCEKCGKRAKILHGSHVLSVRHDATAADLDNIMCMCYFCHIRWWHQYPMEASEWFKAKWPGRYERLESKIQNHTKKMLRFTDLDWKKIYDSLS